MRCPCGNSEIEPHTFREYLRNTQEARMSADIVLKGERFGGKAMRRVRGTDGVERVQVFEDVPAAAEPAKPKARFRWPWEKRADAAIAARDNKFDPTCGC